MFKSAYIAPRFVKEYAPKSTSFELDNSLIALFPPEINTNWVSSIKIPEVVEPKKVDIYNDDKK